MQQKIHEKKKQKEQRREGKKKKNFLDPEDDLLNFKDSEPESIISYFENVDTPIRVINESNEFINKGLAKQGTTEGARKSEEQRQALLKILGNVETTDGGHRGRRI